MGLTPQFLHVSSSASNDALTVALVTASLALALWWLRHPASAPRVVTLGVVTGLATLAKVSGLSGALSVGVLLLLGGSLPVRQRLAQIARYGAAFVGVSGWWFWRNWRLYGELTATRIHLQVYGVPPYPLTWQRFTDEWAAVAASYWASFGWGGINLPHRAYRVAFLLAGLLALLFVVELIRGWRRWDGAQRALVALSLFQLMVVGALLAQWMRLTVAPLGRLLFPAALPISLILMMGLLSLAPRRREGVAAGTVLVGMAVVALGLALGLIRPRYAPAAPLARLPADAIAVDARFGEAVALVGYTLSDAPVAPGETLPLTLFWRTLAPLEANYSVGVKVFGRGGALLARDDSYPDEGRWPSRAWPPGVLIPDRRTLRLAPDAQVPALAQLQVDLFRLEGLESLPVTVAGQPVAPYRPASLVVRPAGQQAGPPASFRVRPAEPRVSVQGGAAIVEFVWEVGQPLERAAQAFFHLSRDPQQPPLEQADFAPLDGAFPTSHWWPGDRLPDQSTLSLPPEAEPGDYELILGLYDLASGQRVEGEAGRSAWSVGRLRWDGRSWTVLDE